ncbi:MAG TPA: hypothetical protein VF798_15175 [Burkholderiaceae bacterium]
MTSIETVLYTAKTHTTGGRESAHQLCPYSKATRGNIAARLNVL